MVLFIIAIKLSVENVISNNTPIKIIIVRYLYTGKLKIAEYYSLYRKPGANLYENRKSGRGLKMFSGEDDKHI